MFTTATCTTISTTISSVSLQAKRHRYRHLSIDDLEQQLAEASGSSRHRMVVTDGVFSMDGHVAPLKEICAVAAKYDAQVGVLRSESDTMLISMRRVI